MKRLIYQVYVGKQNKLYNFCTSSVEAYCKDHNIDYQKQTRPLLMIRPDPFCTNRSRESYEKYGGYLPIYEKENAFSFLDEYDQVAIIDADVWIRPGSPNIFDQVQSEYNFGGVVERDMPITDAYRRKIANYSRMQYSTLKSIDWKWNESGAEFFNMGVMVLNKSMLPYLKGETPEQFIRRPEFKDFVDGIGPWKWSTDQTLLNTWVRQEKMKLKYLDWKWNALYKGVKDKHVKDAHFVHFFLRDHLPQRGENVEELLKVVS